MKYKKLKLCDSQTAYKAVRHLRHEAQEVFVVVGVATNGQLAGVVEVARGTMTECLVSPADVFRVALKMAVPRIIVAHNHPSGCVTPSPQDMAMTRRIHEAGHLLGIVVLDHIIVGSGRVPAGWKAPIYSSLRDMGMFNFETLPSASCAAETTNE